MHLFILLKTGSSNIKFMRFNYIKIILKKFPDIASGRKNFKFFEKRVRKNLILTKNYFKNKNRF
jgi:hypothetical protein